VTILCSDPEHPVNAMLGEWAERVSDRAETRLVREVEDVGEGEFLFLIACQQIVKKPVRDRFTFTLVVHASELPKGRGWSPHVWQILEGRTEIQVSLLNAEDAVDTGAIWHVIPVQFDGTEVHDEIHRRISEATVELMSWALDNCPTTTPTVQQGEPSYYPRRTPADSQVQPDQTIAEIFDLLRVADPARYPAFFDYRGHRYTLTLRRLGPAPSQEDR